VAPVATAFFWPLVYSFDQRRIVGVRLRAIDPIRYRPALQEIEINPHFTYANCGFTASEVRISILNV
jgi:hypothetical protein